MGIKQEAGYDIDTVLEEEGQKRLESFGFSSVKEYTDLFLDAQIFENKTKYLAYILGKDKGTPHELIKYLLENGASTYKFVLYAGMGYISYVAQLSKIETKRKIEKIQALLTCGVDIKNDLIDENTESDDSSTDTDCDAQIIKMFKDDVLFTGVGKKILTYAIMTKDPQLVEFLIDKGAVVNCFGTRYETPLITAIRGYHLAPENYSKIIDLLIKHGADPYLSHEGEEDLLYYTPSQQIDFIKEILPSYTSEFFNSASFH